MKKITGFISASLATLALSGCSPSSADLDAGAVLQCEYAQFIVASGNDWLEKKPNVIAMAAVEVKNNKLTQEEADTRVSDAAAGYIELAQGLGLSGDSSVKQSEEFDAATEKYRNAVVDEDTIFNPYLDDVVSLCEAVGVSIDLKASDPDSYR